MSLRVDIVYYVDMVSNTYDENPVSLPDLNALRLDRDRRIALEFVRREESKFARREIADEFGVNLRLVYRAIDAHLSWAREEFKKEKGQTPATGSDPTKTTEACTPTTSEGSLAQPPRSRATTAQMETK